MALEPGTLPLKQAQRLGRNAKAHDIGAIHTSINQFGFLEPVVVNRRTGHILSGHGRIDDLQQRKARGEEPPANIQTQGKEWFVPAVYVEVPEEHEEAAAIALNRTGQLGGWDDAMLAQVLSGIAAQDEELLRATGYDGDDLDSLLKAVGNEEVQAPKNLSGQIVEQWMIVIECADEEHQRELLERFSGEGLNCRAIIS